MSGSPTDAQPVESGKEPSKKKPRKAAAPPASPSAAAPVPPGPLPYPPPFMSYPYQQPGYHGSPPPPQPYYHLPPYYQYPPPGQFPPVVGQHVGQPVVMYSQPPPPQTPAGESSSSKRKRKDSRKDDDTDEDARHAADVKKRTKTARACDSCRSRKIRCDILAEADPVVCQHCKQYGFECTFFLPITETRFKKKKLADDEQPQEKPIEHRPRSEHEPPIFGSITLPHPVAPVPPRVYESYDLRYHHTFDVFVTPATGDIIQVRRPPRDDQHAAPPLPKDMHVEPDLIQNLLNAYFHEVAPMLPIITPAEFLATSRPPPLLLYSMCLIAAARREVPQGVFDNIRYTVNALIRADDVLSTASIVNVQSLLILCMTGDCHSQYVPNALSALWVRLGTAIRMAQDLGLHRTESVPQDIELRRRLWGACVVSDRWISLTYGHPYMIDVQDCDTRLPSGGDLGDLYMDELVRLSVLLGRVLKTIYSPAGLAGTTDEMLQNLLSDIEGWRARLPEGLKFQGVNTPVSAGILHLLYTCTCMIFWRVFMRMSYTPMDHLKFALTVDQWSNLVALTGDAIDWLDANEAVYDVWLVIAYGATSCALVQYHTWARRRDPQARAKLGKLRDCVRRWEARLSPDHMSARRKTSEIIGLLYQATTSDEPITIEDPSRDSAVNKTPTGIEYKRDPSRPGGGVFVTGDGTELDVGRSPALEMSSFVTMSADAQAANNIDFNNIGLGDQLDGLPGGMFDWGQWDSFFARLNGAPAVALAEGAPSEEPPRQ